MRENCDDITTRPINTTIMCGISAIRLVVDCNRCEKKSKTYVIRTQLNFESISGNRIVAGPTGLAKLLMTADLALLDASSPQVARNGQSEVRAATTR
jgi:hypothetical protein